MAIIHFFCKPNCSNNEKQKALLKAAGHTVLDYDITRHEFSTESLRSYFGTMGVVDWFNVTAPAIKSGKVIPSAMSEADALAAMLVDRLLIRRPFMQIGNERFCGFDTRKIGLVIELQAQPGEEVVFTQLLSEDIVTCPNMSKASCTEKGGTDE